MDRKLREAVVLAADAFPVTYADLVTAFHPLIKTEAIGVAFDQAFGLQGRLLWQRNA